MTIRERVNEHISSFNVGQHVIFSLYDEVGNEAEFIGTIKEIEGRRAKIEYKWGTCYVSLILIMDARPKTTMLGW